MTLPSRMSARRGMRPSAALGTRAAMGCLLFCTAASSQLTPQANESVNVEFSAAGESLLLSGAPAENQSGGGPVSPAPESPSSAAQPAPGVATPAPGAQVSPHGINLPSGPGKVTGMGESFSAQLTTGIANFTIPFHTAGARAGVQPALALGYSSGSGAGIAGVGWGFGVPSIARQTDRGVPGYQDPANGNAWHPQQDRFIFGGGQELVPVCTVQDSVCVGALPGEFMPTWADGWQYFRARVESGFARFFWSPDHLTWRIQSKDGSQMELGVPLDGSRDDGALERNPDRQGQVYRWLLVRSYDGQGDVHGSSPKPVNVAYYRYLHDGGTAYLSEVFDTSPAVDPTTQNLALFGNHTVMHYEPRSDSTVSYRAGFEQTTRLRLLKVDITTKPFRGDGQLTGPEATPSGAVTAARRLLRRYHLSYDPATHASLLTAVQMEGRCTSRGDSPAELEGLDQRLGTTQCPRLPPVKLRYQRVSAQGQAPVDSQGLAYEPFDQTVQALQSSPPYSLGDDTELMDVNADGLPDVVDLTPRRYAGAHGAFLNQAAQSAMGFSTANIIQVGDQVPGVDGGVLRFTNRNVRPMDADGDGHIDLVHMPSNQAFSVFSLDQSDGFRWVGRTTQIERPSRRLDLSQGAHRSVVADVNADGLVDLMVTTATEYQVYLALGRFPGGDGRFGSGQWTGPDTASLSVEPLRTCVPWSAKPVLLGDDGVQLAEMNGDGLLDVVLLKSGKVQYWPGRGDGVFGTGDKQACQAGGFAAERHVLMTNPPQFGTTAGGPLLVNDINADGLGDLIEVHRNSVSVYLNENGHSWTDRVSLADTPVIPAGLNTVRLADIDGSGTPDILWGNGHDYRYIDLTDGVQPYLLVGIDNGLGASTELQYASSTKLMLEANERGEPWTSTMPLVTRVVTSRTVNDHLDAVGRQAGQYVVEYRYRDPVYEGRSRDFRGFREAVTVSPGASDSDTKLSRSVFRMGECSDAELPGVDEPCAPKERWRDLGVEALRGTPLVSEELTADGTYLSSSFQSLELRQLYAGLDGRKVMAAFAVGAGGFSYDTTPFTPNEESVSVLDVRRASGETTRVVTKRSTSGTVRIAQETDYDNFGNVSETRQFGCVEGCEDPTVTTRSVFELIGPSGWLWAATANRSFSDPERILTSRTEYTPNGNVERTFATLFDTLPLDRFHASGGAVAPTPPGASGGIGAAVEVETSFTQYDLLGNVTAVKLPNNGCSKLAMDPDYGALPIASSVYVGSPASGCGSIELKRVAAYDRGTGLAIWSQNPHGQIAAFEYDNFGRLTAEYGPKPGDPGPSYTTGQLSPLPRATYSYELTADPETQPYSVVQSRAHLPIPGNAAHYHTSRRLVDGLGRVLVQLAEADPSAEDAGDYLVGGAVEYDVKGRPFRAYEPYFGTGAMQAFDLSAPTPTNFTRREYDGFGRVVATFDLDGTQVSRAVYNTLSVDAYDANALANGITFVTSHADGFGRSTRTVERVREAGQVHTREVVRNYYSTGELKQIERLEDGVVKYRRWMRYDSFGRLVLNVEPHTSATVSDFAAEPDPEEAQGQVLLNPSTPPQEIRTWRYRYDDSGKLVGTSDARGCGENYHYDAGGRLLAVDVSPCESHQAAYSAPDLQTGNGTESFYRYDTADPEAASVTDAQGRTLSLDSRFLLGRLTSTADRSSKSIVRYHPLGGVDRAAIKIKKPGVTPSALSQRYASRWYLRTTQIDDIGRALSSDTGNPLPALNAANGRSEVSHVFSKTGDPYQVQSSYGTLMARRKLAADGRLLEQQLGDAAGTLRTLSYDTRLRLEHVLTARAAAPQWTNPSPPHTAADADTSQLLLEDTTFVYDVVGNPAQIQDHRIPDEWPSAARPSSRVYTYYDDYRIKSVNYQYGAHGNPDPAPPAWTDPFAPELGNPDRPQPSPHVSFTNRVQSETYVYDSLGNVTQNRDDADGFYDRSIGTPTYGGLYTKPNQMRGASNNAFGSTRTGNLETRFDNAGNLTALVVRRDGPCLPTSASCSQRYHYAWDEVGNLARARRWDLTTAEATAHGTLTQPLPPRAPQAELNYHYTAGGSRILKTALDTSNNERHTAYIFSSLELRSTEYDPVTADYKLTTDNVTLYLTSGGGRLARIVYGKSDLPALQSGSVRMFHLFGDYLGSTNTLIDHDTGELVEKTTYSAYGLTESDYRPERWGEFREDYRFTGKEDDIEVGLTYFGARYYAPHLGTWCSADPVTIHELGSDMNPYSYVGGRVTTAVDPNGEELITIAVGIGIGFALAAGTNATAQYVATGRVDWGQVAIAGGIGAVSGLAGAGVSGAIGGLGGAVAGGATGGAVGSGLNSAIQGQSFGDVMKSAGIGAAIGAVTGAASFGGSYAGAYLSDGNAYAAGIGGGLTGAGAGIGISAAQGELSFESALIAVGSGVISGTINGYRSSLEQRSQQRAGVAQKAVTPRQTSSEVERNIAEIDALISDAYERHGTGGVGRGMDLAIQRATELWGFKHHNARFDPFLNQEPGWEGAHAAYKSGTGEIKVGPLVTDARGLVSALAHENVHATQHAQGRFAVAGTQGDYINEIEAYDYEIRNAASLGASLETTAFAVERRVDYFKSLSPANQARVGPIGTPTSDYGHSDRTVPIVK